MKICVYGICKDEQKFVDRFMDSCQDADVVVIGVDPGDTTGDMLEARGAKVVRVDLPNFRFDHYRNEVLMRIPSDVDVCVSLDLDEVLPDGWRETIEKDWVEGTTRLVYNLQWSPDRCFEYDRIHARHGYTWRHATHEAVYELRVLDGLVSKSSLVVTHLPDWRKDRSKNLKLLMTAVDEDPGNPRMSFYLLREYWYEEMFEKCVDQARSYMALSPPWAEERAWACIFAARSYDWLDKPMDAIAWLNWAIRTAPNFRDPRMELATYHCQNHEFKMADGEFEDISCSPWGRSNFFESNGAYDEGLWILKARIAIGLKKNPISAIKKALRINPDSKRAQEMIDKL